ncbi:hypothetical protein [Kitasatospora viridis]|uniref:Secreted protein n=1 Tax=Kitasatospora viridis TaxID=281105 RepID=A0A561TT88_9ACTN|nr:hypothetical protein [Kitasatospora viridis]TWF90326.1 hypothetical protein FHX73_13370 [Kitasatospora viridis]
MVKPLLYLDVDGPLNPFAARLLRRPRGYTSVRVDHEPKPFRIRLNPRHGPALLALDYELCWGTAWMASANQWIAPVVGLPELPFVDFAAVLHKKRADGVHWKTEPLIGHAAGRPFAWVDDELGELDEAFVAEHHGAPALLHRIDPRLGLREQDFAALARFARSVALSSR